jgi:hypothetical protein
MQAGDQGEAKSEPWTYSRNTLPVTLYSTLGMWKTGKNKTLRPRYRKSKKNYWKIEDAQRILSKLVPPEKEQGDLWALRVIEALRTATLAMMEKLLPFLPPGRVQALYDFCIDLLDKFFGIMPTGEKTSITTARQLIIFIADRVGISVTFPK